MTKVTNQEIEKIAKLSRLSFTRDETKEFASQVSEIISWVDKLNQVNTDNVEAMIAVGDDLTMREDQVKIANDTDQILNNSADRQYDFFAVPKFVE